MKGVLVGGLVLLACVRAATALTPALPDDAITAARLSEALRQSEAHADAVGNQLNAVSAALAHATAANALAHEAYVGGRSGLVIVAERLRQTNQLVRLRGNVIAAERQQLRKNRREKQAGFGIVRDRSQR